MWLHFDIDYSLGHASIQTKQFWYKLIYILEHWNLKTCRSLWPAENESCRSHMKSYWTVTVRQLFVVTKWGKYCYILRQLVLLQNAANVVTKWGSCYKVRQKLLESEAVVTKWGNCYKIGHNRCKLSGFTVFHRNLSIFCLKFNGLLVIF